MSQTIELPGLTVVVACGFLDRLIGLLGRRSIAGDTGLLLTRCNNIHTAFMRFPIDRNFLNNYAIVLGIRPNLAPFRIAISRGASACLELRGGSAEAHGIEVGHCLTPLVTALEGVQ